MNHDGDDDARPATAGRRLFRFVVGVALIGPERLSMGLGMLDELGPPAPITDAPPASPRHVFIGAVSRLPAGLARTRVRVTPLVQRWGRRSQRMAARALPRRAVAGLRSLRQRMAARIASWQQVGQREEAAGRRLVDLALRVVPGSVMSAVSDSPDVRQFLQNETAGLTRNAIDRLRQTSARADDVSESVTRRVFGRREPDQR
jgi:hypothetical protein